MPTGKVLIIGLDGAAWPVLEPLIQAGLLPHLEALVARGARGTLRSTVPALTLPAWSSFMTGKNPGRHGVFAFRRLVPNGYDRGGIANTSDLRSATIWEIASRAGRHVGVINVPPSYPIRPVNGFVVSCMLTPPGDARWTDPPEVADELGSYRIDTELPRDLQRDRPDYAERANAYLSALRQQVEWRAGATLRLMQQRPWDLLCVVFYAPDRAQHFFWQHLDGIRQAEPRGHLGSALRSLYAALDAAVGQLVEAAGSDTTVVVVSDHGFVPAPHRLVRVNRWLADHGLLHQRPLWRMRRKVVRNVLPATWRRRYDSPEYILYDRAKTRAWCEVLDEPGTAAIWVHARERYPLGCVAPGAEYEAVRRRIQDGLRTLADEDGTRVFRSVQLREEVYEGPYVGNAPDLLAVCAEGYGIGAKPLAAELRCRTVLGPFDEASYSGHTGVHDPFGIYIFAGPHIRPLGAHETYPIEAIAPTVLHALGLPVPRAMDGAVGTTLFDPRFLADHPVRMEEAADDDDASTADWNSAEDEALIAERLRSLGYLE